MKPILAFLAFGCSAAVAAPPKLAIYPQSIVFDNPRQIQRVIVLGATDLSREAKFAIEPAGVAVVENGVVRPLNDGTATLTVTAGGSEAKIAITSKLPVDAPVNFATEIEPILTKAGCNGGACHGAQHGRGGFRLSLFGFDPAFDHDQIVRSNEGRRVVLSDPDRSILLAKPALVMEHGGGGKLKLNSREYETLRRWMEDGAPEPPAKEATVTKLEVFPTKRVMAANDLQQLAVTAVWSDGRREDVTPLAQFDALNDAVASVTANGLVTTKGAGETHVMIRFLGQATIAQTTIPFAAIKDYPKLPTNNFIDEKLIAKWKDLGLTPSPLTNDAEFLRRLYLDAIGTLPKPDEVRKFLADSDPKKRTKAIDAVLERPEFLDWWALKWGDLLRINRQALDEKGMWSFHNWVRASVRDNKPADEFARDILTAEGSTYTDGPSNFYRVARSPDEWSEAVTQVFLGVRVQCAKCHHHPFEKWSQDDYYGMVAFFSRLGTKTSQEFGIFTRETVIFLRPTGEATHPRKRKVVKPHPFDGPEMDDEFDRRRKLAEWMTTPENPFFAKNIVNRFWGYLMGRGLVEPLDDMRATNPASNPELLDALAKDFVANKFDVKRLLKTIFHSRAYQLSSQTAEGNKVDAANIHFARYTTKRLTAEQTADALDAATGTQEKYPGLPLGTRAAQLPDPEVRSFLLDTFGRPARQVVCECERTTKPNIAQAMHLMNGDFLNKKIADANGRIETLLKAKAKPDAAIEELYLATLSRTPTKEELAKAQSWVASGATPKDGLQDLLWVLLNSREFLFNH
jgi:Protein of unknown function (DUF1553)/Protein of unknown function (DUF1549)